MKPLVLSKDEIEHVLHHLDPDESYVKWLEVGMALHHETGGSKEGLIMWSDWSNRGVKGLGIQKILFEKWELFERASENSVITFNNPRFNAEEK